MAALALHRFALRRPAALIVGNGPQCGDEIVFLHQRAVVAEFGWRFRAAVGADKGVLRGGPDRLGSAGRAGEFGKGGDFRHAEAINRRKRNPVHSKNRGQTFRPVGRFNPDTEVRQQF